MKSIIVIIYLFGNRNHIDCDMKRALTLAFSKEFSCVINVAMDFNKTREQFFEIKLA